MAPRTVTGILSRPPRLPTICAGDNPDSLITQYRQRSKQIRHPFSGHSSACIILGIIAILTTIQILYQEKLVTSGLVKQMKVDIDDDRLELPTSSNNSTTAPIRVMALCACIKKGTGEDVKYDPFDVAFTKLSELIPEIEYAGVFRRMQQETSPSSSCEDQIEQWMATRLLQHQQQQRDTSYADTSHQHTMIEVIYTPNYHSVCQTPTRPLNQTLIGLSSSGPPKWIGGMHLPSNPTHFQRHLKDWGEVASAKDITCNPRDTDTIHIYRSRVLWTKSQDDNCPVVHYPSVIFWALHFLQSRVKAGVSPTNETVLSMLTHRNSWKKARQILDSKSQFGILLTMTTMQPNYAVDSLVRHALCRLLTKQYKTCHAIHSWKGGTGELHNITLEKPISAAYKAQQDYKFVITMPNHFQDGYIAEKTLSPFIANAVAITSIPNVGKYVNALGMVTCDVPEDELKKVQRYYRGNFDWMPFNTTPAMWENSNDNPVKHIHYDPYAVEGKGDEPVLEFATSQWEAALQPCIKEIIRLDQNDDAYIQKLMQPYLLNEGKHSLFDGTYVAISMLQWFIWARSPLVSGLENIIASLEGVREQTPGSGVP